MLAASIASTIGGLPFNALPVMLGSLAEAFKLEPAAVGFMGSVCFAGYLLGTLGCARGRPICRGSTSPGPCSASSPPP